MSSRSSGRDVLDRGVGADRGGGDAFGVDLVLVRGPSAEGSSLESRRRRLSLPPSAHHRGLLLGVLDGLDELRLVHGASTRDVELGCALAQLDDGQIVEAFSSSAATERNCNPAGGIPPPTTIKGGQAPFRNAAGVQEVAEDARGRTPDQMVVDYVGRSADWDPAAHQAAHSEALAKRRSRLEVPGSIRPRSGSRRTRCRLRSGQRLGGP